MYYVFNYLSDDPVTIEVFEIIFSLLFGFILAPFSWNIYSYIIFVIFFEIILFWLTDGLMPYWKMRTRILVNVAALIGWIIGRLLFCKGKGYKKFFTHEDKDTDRYDDNNNIIDDKDINKEDINKEDINKEDINKEDINKEDINKEDINKEDNNKEDINKEDINKEDINDICIYIN
jgi:hypothetical protein